MVELKRGIEEDWERERVCSTDVSSNMCRCWQKLVCRILDCLVLCKSGVQFTSGELSQMKKQFLPSAALLNLL